MGDEFTDKIVIGLCTFKRNEPLKEALDSLTRVEIPADTVVEFILVDNDQSAGARPVFDAYMPDMPFRSHYFVEEKRGLSCVRNRVIEEALKLDATAIAMFDDDEIVAENWLVELYKAYKTSGVDGVWGSVFRLLHHSASETVKKFWKNAPRNEGIDDISRKDEDGNDIYMLGTNNCLFSARLVKADGLNIRFSKTFNFSGREDTAFAFDAVLKGASFTNAPLSVVMEKFSKERSTLRYLLRRWFGWGLSDYMIVKCYKFGVVKRTFREIFMLIFRTLLLPFAAICGKEKLAKMIFKLAASLGWICGICGQKGKYYLKHKD
jgi:glycosyltransferase involved in cell wall biosynthesis